MEGQHPVEDPASAPEPLGTDCSAVEDVILRAGDLGCLRARIHFVEEKTEVPPKHHGGRVGRMQFDQVSWPWSRSRRPTLLHISLFPSI